MPRVEVKERTLFKFDELSEQAKQKATETNRDILVDHNWWDSVYDDADNIAEILGISLDRTGDRLSIYFSGFYSQGDGASFAGKFRYKKGMSKRIREYAPTDTTLHDIADRLSEIHRTSFYAIYGEVWQSGYYCHSGTMRFDFRSSLDVQVNEACNKLAECFRDFADWIYTRLESEYDYLTSDEAIAETLIVNEFEFDEFGNVD